MSLPLLAALVAAAATAAATPLVIRFARARALFCMPGERRIHTRPVPRVGGVAVVIGVFAALVAAAAAAGPLLSSGAAWTPPARVLAGLAVGGVIVFGAGLVDDLRGLRPLVKLVAQVTAAVVVYGLGFQIEHLSLGGGELLVPWVSLPLTVLWVVGVTNAYNLVDGMDGLATGLGLVAFGATIAAAAALGNADVVLVAAVLFGALAGFLPWNFNPARIFLGDSGSLFIGFSLAVLSVHGSTKSSTAVLVAVPLFALAIPLLDTAVAMARRWLRGLPLSQADARHIHHRLLALGMRHRDAVLVLYTAAALFAGLGILLAFAPPPELRLIAVAAGLASIGVVVAGMRGLGYDEFMLAGKVLASGPLRARRVIRDKLAARDLAGVLVAARDREEIQAALADAAPIFGLLHMEVTAESAHGGPRAPAGTVWKLDFPLCESQCPFDPLVLRLRAPISDGMHPRSTERVAHILGDALRQRMDLLTAPCGGLCGQEPVQPDERASAVLSA